MRIPQVTLADPESAALWHSITGKKVNLIPHRHSSLLHRNKVEQKIREHYVLGGPLAFLQVQLQGNRSEFLATLRPSIRRDDERYLIEVSGAVAVANAVAYVSELLDLISMILMLTNKNLMKQSFSYLFWGEGEVALLACTILVR